jgi:hypothetical protein
VSTQAARIVDEDLDGGFDLDEGALLLAAAGGLGQPMPTTDKALGDEAVRLHALGQTL